MPCRASSFCMRSQRSGRRSRLMQTVFVDRIDKIFQDIMSTLNARQLADYEELGFLDSIPILSTDEVRHFRAEVDKTCAALGGRVTRLDGPHLCFRWAWDLS